MYETEINWQYESLDQLPPKVRAAFCERKDTVSARSVLAWSEHCTECAAPACFQTCELYQARPRDSKCRRFVDGMVFIDHSEGLLPYILKIKFKRWGKLWTWGNIKLYSLAEANRMERNDRLIGAAIRTLPLDRLPLPKKLRQRIVGKRYYDKVKFSQRPSHHGPLPDLFLIECFNPQREEVRMTFEVVTVGDETIQAPPFQRLLAMNEGFNRFEIPVDEIASAIDLRDKFKISLIPNEIPEGTIVYFGITEFVRDRRYTEDKLPAGVVAAKDCKCVVWDLDNTLWSGTLVEDGADALQLKPGVVDVIKELDRRGILLSIASKNDQDEALKKLDELGLSEYFLSPQISWGPKSLAIEQVANALNIGLDTLLFLDDQLFEREEVSTSLPVVRVLPAEEFHSLLSRPDCQGSSTADAARRRLFYRDEIARRTVEGNYGNKLEGYLQFLKDCDIHLTIRSLEEEGLQRVHELVQRTNQLNFSGNRYTRDELVDIRANSDLETFVMECRDRFGDYGTVGFSVVDEREPRVLDLAFSCRIQNKRVEHAFLGYLAKRYHGRREGGLRVNFRPTPRNSPQARVFDDLGFDLESDENGLRTMSLARERELPDYGIVKIHSRIDSAEPTCS